MLYYGHMITSKDIMAGKYTNEHGPWKTNVSQEKL